MAHGIRAKLDLKTYCFSSVLPARNRTHQSLSLVISSLSFSLFTQFPEEENSPMAPDENHTPINAMDEGDDEEDTEEEEDDVDGDGELNVTSVVVEEEEEEEEAADEPPEEDDGDEEEEEDLSASLDSDPTRSVTVAVPPPTATADIPIVEAAETVHESMAKRPRIVQDEPIGERRIITHHPLSQPGDDQARKLFQRLWTDEDEIGLLQGFLEYSTQRGTSQNNPHDTALFYDQIKSKLQLDFNKNQLVEKLRRLKKKYRNVLARISSCKEISFKNPHDQATFEIACKIWGTAHKSKDQMQQQNQQQQQHLLRWIDIDEDMPPNFNPTSTNLNLNSASNYNSSGGHSNHHSDRIVDERKSQHKSKKRIRVKNEDIRVLMDRTGAMPTGSNHAQNPVWLPGIGLSTPAIVDESMKNRLSPLIREMYEISGGSRGFGDGIVSPLPLSFARPVNMFGMEGVDDRWRKQQILELEVYSKRLELVQEHIKLTLEQLRSMRS